MMAPRTPTAALALLALVTLAPASTPARQIFVKSNTGATETLEAGPGDTVDAVKAKYEVEEGVPAAEQKLAFQGKLLAEGGKTLAAYGAPAEATLDLAQVTVKTDTGATTAVPSTGTESVGELKAAVEEEEGTAADQQKLSFQGKSLADDTKALSDYSIPEGDTLDLSGMRLAGPAAASRLRLSRGGKQ